MSVEKAVDSWSYEGYRILVAKKVKLQRLLKLKSGVWRL